MSESAPCSGFQSRRFEPASSLDDFPTPPWATRALTQLVLRNRLGLVWEPACGRGHMARPLAERGHVFASDVFDYRFDPASALGWRGQDAVYNFLDRDAPPPQVQAGVDWIITNPPFNRARDFIATAFSHQPRRGVAMFVRSAFLEGIDRFRLTFEPHPPAVVAQFVERVPIFRGRLTRRGSTMTAYCWIVWRSDFRGPTRFQWIRPCRAKLEQDEDYPVAVSGGVDAYP